jgi:hypothetical protein
VPPTSNIAMSASAATQMNRWQDVSAGLSIAGLLLPEAVAYASIGNLAPQAGILALFAGLLCYGVLGTSRFAIVSATSSSAAVLAAAMASMPGGTAGHRLMLMAGLVMLTEGFFLLAWVARLGSVTQFIAKPVLRGFSFGLAIVIIVKQLPGVLGVQPPQGDMLHLVPGLLARAGQWNGLGAGRWRQTDRARQGGAPGPHPDRHAGRSVRRQGWPGNPVRANAANHHGDARQVGKNLNRAPGHGGQAALVSPSASQAALTLSRWAILPRKACTFARPDKSTPTRGAQPVMTNR